MPFVPFLHLQVVARSTCKKYVKAVHAFLEWTRLSSLSPATVDDLDFVLAEYIHDLYITGGKRYLATDVVYGLCWLDPSLRGRLVLSTRSVLGWGRLLPSASFPPMPLEVVAAVAATLFKAQLPCQAFAVLLAFDCYLRIGELLALRFSDVVVPGDLLSLGGRAALRLRHTKTGPNKYAAVRSVYLSWALRFVVLQARAAGVPSDRSLFPFSQHGFRCEFGRACRALGLAEHGFTPHSLRHGAATCDALAGVPVETILERGRWASSSSARRYVQSGRALLIRYRVPGSVSLLGRSFLSVLPRFLSSASQWSFGFAGGGGGGGGRGPAGAAPLSR
jgi:hypothetical protein